MFRYIPMVTIEKMMEQNKVLKYAVYAIGSMLSNKIANNAKQMDYYNVAKMNFQLVVSQADT
jgi:hypothetical protein